jgi:single-stranded-DNA-specific exonuclease
VGVVGIVASRLVQRFHRPVVLLAGPGDEAVGSARSIRGVDLVESLAGGGDHMLRFGGHAAAAGLAVRRADFAAFRDWFERDAFASLPAEAWTPRLSVDAEWPVEDVDRDLALRLEQLEPHGIGNPRPRFLAHDVEVRGKRTVRRGAIQMRLGPSPGLQAIAFRSPLPADSIGRRIDVVYGIQRRRFRGVESIQLQIEDLRNAGGDTGT